MSASIIDTLTVLCMICSLCVTAFGNFLSNFYRLIVIGDLPEHEAEQFLFNALLNASAHSNALSGIESSVSDEKWKRIYEVKITLYNIIYVYSTLHHTACLH
jgi:hypothetical protein